MSTDEDKFYSPLKNSKQEDSFDFLQALSRYLSHWRYFVISMSVTMVMAIVYLYFSKPVYEVKATLLIQDEKKSSDETSSLKEIEVVHSSKLVENEIEVLQSRNLILQVVNALHLGTRYQFRDGYKKRELYSDSPVQFRGLNTKDTEFEVFILDNKTFLLKDSTNNERAYKFNEDYDDRLGLWKLESTKRVDDFIGKTIHISLVAPEKIADAYQANLEVLLLNKNAPVVGLAIAEKVEQRGKDFLNSLIEHYNTATIAEKAQKNQSTLNFIDQRLATLSGELNASEAEVESFRSSRGLTDISTQSQVYLESVQRNDIRLNEVNVQLNVIKGIEEYLDASENVQNLPSVIGISDPGLNHLIQQLSQLQSRKAELLATTPENNPVFNPLNRQIDATRSAIRNNISNTKLALLNTRQELESFNSKIESSIRDIPVQERQLVSIKRQQTIKEDLYVYLLKKREELSLSYAATLTDAKVIDSAYAVPEKGRKKLLVVALAFIFGLGFPAGIVYAKESLNNTIATQEDVEKITNAIVLGKIFHSKDTRGKNVFVSAPGDKTKETFRTLRTNINFALTNSPHKTILVTSCLSGDGKTFNALNIAASYAQMGRKTVLLNFDLRNAHSVIKKTDKTTGLSRYLNEEVTLSDIIQKTEFANLHFIDSGPVPPNPLDLMEKDIMTDLFNFLKKEYEYIIIDTPPLAQVSDALAIIRFASLNLIVARCNVTKKKLLKVVLSELRNKKIRNVYVVLNDNKLISEQMGYGYYRK